MQNVDPINNHTDFTSPSGQPQHRYSTPDPPPPGYSSPNYSNLTHPRVLSNCCSLIPSMSDNASISSDTSSPAPEDVKLRPSKVAEKETASLQILFDLMKKFTPHIKGTFVLEKNWWDLNAENPGIHMFKHVLFRAAQTTINIFCLAAAPSPQRCQTLIEEYNQTAKPVWEQEDQELAERQRQCEEIHKSFFTRSFEPSCSDDIVPIPAHIAIKFDNIFRKYYCSSEKYLLFGRMDDDALEVQDNYGLEVATVLSEYKSRYGARAHLSLRKIYGRGAPLPLLSGASATAMWNACSSRYYQQQISTLHTWVEPFPEIASAQGCGFQYSLHWLLQPKLEEEEVVFIEFYRALMEWSTDLHLVSLLQKYLFTPPQVTPLVRGQLQTIDESDKIQVALRQVMKLWRTLETPYDELLNHTCLDWRNERLVNLVSSDLPPAMFDLMLGDKFMRPLLNEYTDVHSVRRRIQNFVELLPGDAQLWWDGVTEYAVPHGRWVSKSLAQDPDFEGLLDSWLNDNQALQTWLQQYEKTTRLVNNSDQPATRVFSEEVAIEVMKFGKVQAGLFDKRRARLFAYKSIEFKEECTALGLFEARLPQFSQLFFHNFTDSETELLLGQSETGGQVAHRAAEAYLRSGVRLESSCGMSDIWYDYVESNAKLFRSPSSAAVPSGPSSLSHPPIFPPLQSSPPPRPDSQQLEHIRSFLDWHKAHLRFRPTEKSVKSPEHESDDCSENSQPEDTTLPPSKVLACHGPDPADAAEQEDEKDASWMEIGKDEHETEGLIVVEEQRVEALGSPIAVAEREDTDTGSDGYQFEDEWPTTRSFEIAMSKMLDQVDLQVSQMPKVSVVTGGHGSDQTLDITKCQTDGAGSSGKRARQDSNASDGAAPLLPSTANGTSRLQRLAKKRKESG